MENNFDKLIHELLKVSFSLEAKKQIKLSSSIDKIAGNLVNIKTAQFLGVQGYRLENGRCMDNCVRVKKAKGGNKSSQEIKNACMDEYVQYVNKKNEDWGKYASNSSGLKKFAQIEATQNKYKEDYIANIDSLLNIALDVKAAGHIDEVKKIADVSDALIKEAQFWQGVKDQFSGRTGSLKRFKQGILQKSQELLQNKDKIANEVKKNPRNKNRIYSKLINDQYSTILKDPLYSEALSKLQGDTNPQSPLRKAITEYKKVVDAWRVNAFKRPSSKAFMDLAQRLQSYAMGELEQAVKYEEKEKKPEPEKEQGTDKTSPEVDKWKQGLAQNVQKWISQPVSSDLNADVRKMYQEATGNPQYKAAVQATKGARGRELNKSLGEYTQVLNTWASQAMATDPKDHANIFHDLGTRINAYIHGQMEQALAKNTPASTTTPTPTPPAGNTVRTLLNGLKGITPPPDLSVPGADPKLISLANSLGIAISPKAFSELITKIEDIAKSTAALKAIHRINSI